MRQVLSLPTQLGHILRSARKTKGMTQRDAAFRLGLSQSRLSALERDAATITVAQLLSLLGVYGLRVAVEEREATVSQAEW